ncbi:MAG: hypothetical protein ABEI78_00640, partial [Candidatus Nanohaloarchaea archaeon]
MFEEKKLRRLLFFLGFTAILLPSVFASHTVDSSNWEIENLQKPYSLKNVSNNSKTVQLVNLTAYNSSSGNYVGLEPDEWDGTFVYSLYNSSGNITSLNGNKMKDIPVKHLGGSIYYANFSFKVEEGYILYEASGTTSSSSLSDSNIEENTSRHFNYGNLTVNILTNFNKDLITGSTVSLEGNVTDTWKTDEHVPKADI